MAKLQDKLYNRVIEGKLTLQDSDDVGDIDLSEVDLSVKSINAKGGAISGPLAVTGNSTIGGDLAVNGGITGDSIIENMSGYAISSEERENISMNLIYVGACKNGNKLTLVAFFDLTRTGTVSNSYIPQVVMFSIPNSVGSKIYPEAVGSVENAVAYGKVNVCADYTTYKECPYLMTKSVSDKTNLKLSMYNINELNLNTKYLARIEVTFLLSDNLVPTE